MASNIDDLNTRSAMTRTSQRVIPGCLQSCRFGARNTFETTLKQLPLYLPNRVSRPTKSWLQVIETIRYILVFITLVSLTANGRNTHIDLKNPKVYSRIRTTIPRIGRTCYKLSGFCIRK